MKLDEYLLTIEQYTKDYDRAFAIKSFQRFCKTHSNYNITDIHQYIQQYFPPDNMVNISSILTTQESPEHCIHVVRAQKWIQQNGYTCLETLRGVYISVHTAQKLQAFLQTAIPVRDVFNEFCTEYNIPFTSAIYENYCHKNKQHLLQTKYHPYQTDRWFWTGATEALHESICRWYMVYSAHIPSDKDGYVSLLDAANMLAIKPEQLLSWLLSQKNAYFCDSGKCYVNVSVIDSICHQWNNIKSVMPLVKEKLAKIPIKARQNVKQPLLEWLDNCNHDWLLPPGTYPQQIDHKQYTDKPLAASIALDAYLNEYPTRQLNCLKDITGMSTKKLKLKASCGAITATTEDSENWYISENEYYRVAEMQKSLIPLDQIVASIICEIESDFDLNSHIKRNHLINYCNENDWWGIEYTFCDDLPIDGLQFNLAIPKEFVESLKDKLTLWLEGYGQTYQSKFELTTKRYSSKFPVTVKELIRFEQHMHKADKALVDMAQLLCLTLQDDISAKSNYQTPPSPLIDVFTQQASLTSCEILSDFLIFSKIIKGKINFLERGRHIEVNAYPVKDYAVMMAFVVNEDIIREGDLIRKAIANKRHADLWLYVSLHIYAAWRSTDYIRMIAPKLPYSPKETLEKIGIGALSSSKLKSIAEDFIATNALALTVPNKTQGTTAVPRLYFYCPQSCLESFGTILAIAAAHHQLHPNAETYVNPVKHWTVIKQFFGDEFLEACGNASFSGRRANKSLLQCIEYAGREGEQLAPSTAYYLASIVRSHKLSYGRLSETTEVYLKDAAFSNLTPEYIAYQMWERGVCSFVADTMLKICYGDNYKSLLISQQTEAIKSIGLSPLQTTNILQCIQEAEDRACEIIQSVCQSSESVNHALKSIVFGYGKNKDQDGYCLCKAAGMECKYKDRLNCIGCTYEIRTKALLLRYAAIHQDMYQASILGDNAEKARLMYLRKTVTYPALQEILTHIDNDVKEEFQLYKELTQEVMTYRTASNRSPRALLV